MDDKLANKSTIFLLLCFLTCLLLVGAVDGNTRHYQRRYSRRHHHHRSNQNRKRAAGGSSWNYERLEPWSDINPVCGNGFRQSPIHLSTMEAVMNPVLFNDPMKFINYDGKYTGSLSNNGHSVVWSIDAKESEGLLPRIAGSGLGRHGFVFDQFHFHWGGIGFDSSCIGSEHVIDFRSAPLEVHLVHHNTKYASFDEAKTQRDGLAVVGFLFTIVDDGIPDGDYSIIAKRIPRISEPGRSIDFVAAFPKLFPLNMLREGIFFRYDGSLTTPPCYESVTWTVFSERIPVSRSTLSAFRTKVMTQDSTSAGVSYKVLDNNFRPPQKLWNRTVSTNSKSAREPYGGFYMAYNNSLPSAMPNKVSSFLFAVICLLFRYQKL